jgi:Xaa-Pro aminopeptidase
MSSRTASFTADRTQTPEPAAPPSAWLAAALGALLLASAPPGRAQTYQSDFPPEEFQARWARVWDAIGSEAVAVVQGVPLTNGFQLPRQSNSIYYLSGIETPHAYLRLDGRARKATLYLPPRNERLERSEGKVLSAADAELVKRLTGADEVLSTEAMGTSWPLGDGATATIYAEHAPAEGYAQSRHELQMADAAVANDAWDGRLSRESRFLELLRTRHPRARIADLTPILDELRAVKSPREIALVRRASELAGLGVMEAIRSTEPGVYEYQLDAACRYVFLLNDARLDGYRSITASGTANIWNAHYYRNSRRLEAGDLVLMDYAPDLRYYVSDIGRMWPVDGRYRPEQRELLQFVLEYRNAVMTRIRPGVSADAIRAEAGQAMDAVFARTRFSKPVYEAAARKLVETGGGVFSHTVGMAVHDVGSYRGLLKPGHVFSVDPQLWVPEENLYFRYEDTGAVTETGFENFTAFLPTELAELEALTREKGIVQTLPAVTDAGFDRLRRPAR